MRSGRCTQRRLAGAAAFELGGGRPEECTTLRVRTGEVCAEAVGAVHNALQCLEQSLRRLQGVAARDAGRRLGPGRAGGWTGARRAASMTATPSKSGPMQPNPKCKYVESFSCWGVRGGGAANKRYLFSWIRES